MKTPHLPAIASAEGRGWEVEGFDSGSRRLWWSPSREEADSIVGENIVFEPLTLAYQEPSHLVAISLTATMRQHIVRHEDFVNIAFLAHLSESGTRPPNLAA